MHRLAATFPRSGPPATVTRLGIVSLALVAAVAPGCRDSAPDKPADGAPARQALLALPYAGGVEAEDDGPTGVVQRDPARSCPGYSLYAVQTLNMAELIDEDGRVVRTWSHAPSQSWENCELLPNGDLLVVGAEPATWPDGRRLDGIADSARYVLRFAWDGRLLWKRKLPVHHDIEQTPDGRLLVLGFRRRIVPEIHPTVPVRDDQLILLDADGNVLESHSMLDAIRQRPDLFPLQPVAPSTLGGPPWVDILHSNSVEWVRHPHLAGRHPLYAPDNVLVCFRHQDRIAVFNWPRSELVWAWGQGEISGPHCAELLESGNILLFDNGVGRDYSRAIELDPLSGRIVWEYRATPPSAFFTLSKGSVQRLPNGNTLLAESDKGRAIEVTPAGEIVWEFICPHRVAEDQRAAIVRIKRYPRELVAGLARPGE